MKIILAVDGSKYSNWAVDLLLKLPLDQEPEVDVLHVVDQAVRYRPVIFPPLGLEFLKVLRAEIERSLALKDRLVTRVAEKMRIRWKKVRPLVERGNAAEMIVKLAEDNGADLIILGSRGLNPIRGFFLGSVSQKVVTYAPCSVLVAKRRPRTVKKFLLAADGSRSSQAAVEFLRSHFRPEKLRGAVLYVWDYPIYPHPEGLLVQTLKERYSVPLMRSGFKVTAQWVMGHPADKIVKVASQKKADLVIVGSRGLTGIRRFLLGGISQKVVQHSHESVLVVR
jgi:nucleotide-binding universal stress UspA family protein